MTATNLSAILTAFVERIEAVEIHISECQADRTEIYKEARAGGIDVKALRKIIGERRMVATERDALNETLDQYRHALGMLADLPLGVVAAAKAFKDSVPAGMKLTIQRPGGPEVVVADKRAEPDDPAAVASEFA